MTDQNPMMDAIRASLTNTDPRCERCGARSSFLALDTDGAHSLCSRCMDALYPEGPDGPDTLPVTAVRPTP